MESALWRPSGSGISHCGWQDSDIWRIQGKMGTAWAQHLLGHKFWSFQIELLANWGHELCEETSEVGIIVHFSSHLVSELNKFLLGGGGFNQSVQFGSVKRSAMLAGRHLPTRSDWKLRCRVVWAVWCIFNSDMISSETRWDRYICTPAHTHTTNMDYILDLIIYIYVDTVYQIYVTCTCISLWIFKGPRRTLQNVQEMEVFDPAGWDDLPNSPGGSQAAQRGLFDLTWELDASWSFKTWMWHFYTFFISWHLNVG